jgi:hypothetical protein
MIGQPGAAPRALGFGNRHGQLLSAYSPENR